MNLTPEQIIAFLSLKPKPQEGGLFNETYVSTEDIKGENLPSRYGMDKSFGTAIYYMLTSDPDSFW